MALLLLPAPLLLAVVVEPGAGLLVLLPLPWGAARGAASACDNGWARELLNTSSSRGGRGGAHRGLWAGAGRDGADDCWRCWGW